MVVDPKLTRGVVKCLGRIWKNREFCDFTVIVEDERIQCHRNVLGACSGFFYGLLNSEMKEQAEGCVKIPNITKPTMDVILNSVYTGENEVTAENVIDVWHASNQLQISFMVTECEKFVMKNMNIENYSAIYETAILLDSSVVMEKVNDFIMKNFDHFCQTKAFLNLPVHILHSIVDSQDLVTSSENVVVESILKWISFNPQPTIQSKVSSSDGVGNVNNEKDDSSSNNTDTELENKIRKRHLAKLLSACRLHLCTPGFLETLRNNKLVSSCPRSCSMNLDAIMQNLDVARHNDCWPPQAVPRHCSLSQPGFIFTFICQKNNAGNRSMYADFYFYKLSANKQFKICNFDIADESRFSITVFNNELYCYNSDLYLLGRNKKWSKVNEMHGMFNKTILVSHGDYIYASHVKSNNQNQFSISVYRLQINNRQDNRWNLCLKVSQKKDKHSLVSCGWYILLFTQNQQATNTSVTCYNPEKQTIRELTDMEGTPENVISFCVEKQVYVLQENGSLWKAINCHVKTETLDLEFVSTLFNSSWLVCSAAVYRGQLWVFDKKLDAGNDDSWPASLLAVFDQIEKVAISSPEVIKLSPMCAPTSWLQKQKIK